MNTLQTVSRYGSRFLARGAVSPSWMSARCMSTTTDIPSFVASTIADNKIALFTKTYCPHCAATKDLFEMLEEPAAIVELDIRDDGSDIQDYLQSMTGQRSVPNVFVKGQHIGGNDDTQEAFREGKLQELLK
eukprot:Nitzschia sp. Nitz4//scaffold3_size479765//368588//369045//NITZ4_000154-RA/size479765-augustus-gene-1.580-mRNA-1//1//CDS//3329550920//6619//frame0